MCYKKCLIMAVLLMANPAFAKQQGDPRPTKPCGYFATWFGLFPYFVKCKSDLIIKIPTKDNGKKENK